MPAPARASREPVLRSPSPVFSDFPQQVLHGILAAMPAAEIARVAAVDPAMRQMVLELWPTLVVERRFPAWWPLQKANVVETAAFFDAMDQPDLWQKGPNKKVEGNLLERGADGSWLWLSGGTDWQGFQGGFRRVSEDGLRPSWVSFRVQVGTPSLSGAFLRLAADTHTWGLEDILLQFEYRGDDCQQDKRCFSVQTTASQHGGKRRVCRPSVEVSPDTPYEVAIHFEWGKGVLSVFVDGDRLAVDEPFNVANPVRFVALYNWRSAARTAFSDLALGNAAPCLKRGVGPAAVRTAASGAPAIRSFWILIALIIVACAILAQALLRAQQQ